MRLSDVLMTAPPQLVETEQMKTYKVTCHVCGTDHDLQADFYHAPAVDARGRGYVACKHHTQQQVRKAHLALHAPRTHNSGD